MEPIRTDGPKLPDMIMCGDHPSVTKTELNFEAKTAEKENEKEILTRTSLARISPTPSRDWAASADRSRLRAASEHALKTLARQRARSRDAPQQDAGARGAELVRAALGSLRWPPYLACAWVLLLLLTHTLHCAVALLERALPALRSLCQYFRVWTEDSWRDVDRRPHAAALGCVTALLYAAYCALAAAHALALWAVEPPCAAGSGSEDRTRPTTCADGAGSATDTASRQ